MAQFGADVEQLDRLATQFRVTADEIGQVSNRLGIQIHTAWWEGADADRFKSDWDGRYRAQLRTVCSRLEETAEAVTAQAGLQRRTSGA